MNPIEFATERKKPNVVFVLNQAFANDKANVIDIVKPISSNKSVRKLMTQIFPFLTLFYFGCLFDANLWIIYKILFLGAFYFIFSLFRV